MKKVILVGIMLLMFAGVVSASSVNGDYEGNPIVKIMNYGNIVDPDDVPAVIYNNRTMVPIGILKKLGAEVLWDQDKYAVNVSFPNKITTKSNIIDLGITARQLGGRHYKLIFDGLGAYVEVRLDATNDISNDSDTIAMLSLLSKDTQADEVVVKYYSNDIFKYDVIIKMTSINKWNSKIISRQQFNDEWEIKNY